MAQLCPRRRTFGRTPSLAARLLWAVGWVCCGLLPLLPTAQATEQAKPTPPLQLTISEYSILAEVADTPELRRRGLMERLALTETAGMLFVFRAPARRRCFWMRNTYIPLDVAFIDSQGRIMQVAGMEPLSERTHCSVQPATYALEVSRRWFVRRGLGTGDSIRGLDGVKTSR